MVVQKKSIIFMVFLSMLVSISASAAPLFRPDFEGAEHVAAGNQVILYFTQKEQNQPGYRLHLPNGLTLTYGEILTLGDFYGAVTGPIASGDSPEVRKLRFINAFESLAKKSESVAEASQLLRVMEQEQDALKQGMEKGEKPEDIYARISDDINRQYNCITGGGCSNFWYLQAGRFLTLAAEDIDHFGDNALLAYQTGHDVAIELAISAGKTRDQTKLEVAYAMNAFAGHFLSDRFSSGHIRTPRAELYRGYTREIGGLLSKFMHDEDNHYGVNVSDALGHQWLAYGDKSYYAKENLETRKHLAEALQESANQIFAAYISQTTVKPEEDLVARSIPYPVANPEKNITPLFKWDAKNQQLLRRADIANVYDPEMTANWWGLSTLVLLAQQRGGISPVAQRHLAASALGKQALNAGLITDARLIHHIREH